MSTNNREPGIVKEFRELYEYVYELGKHINSIYRRVERIESELKEVSKQLTGSTTANRMDISVIQETMLTRSEFNEFIDQLKSEVEKTMPSLPQFKSTTTYQEE